MIAASSAAGILVVDGDPIVRSVFAQALEPFGKVEVASNGLDALRLLATRKFDVVLLDLRVPVVDGFFILRTLATRPGPNAETPVYALTSDVSEQARARAMEEHAAFVLTKPVPVSTLTTLIGAALGKDAPPRGAPQGPGPHRTD